MITYNILYFEQFTIQYKTFLISMADRRYFTMGHVIVTSFQPIEQESKNKQESYAKNF